MHLILLFLKPMKKILIILVLFMVSACLAQQEPADYNVCDDAIGAPTSEQGVIQIDSLTVTYLLRTDPTAILMSHVIIKDGVIILDLSEEDAVSLGISPELYSSFSSILFHTDDEE